VDQAFLCHFFSAHRTPYLFYVATIALLECIVLVLLENGNLLLAMNRKVEVLSDLAALKARVDRPHSL